MKAAEDDFELTIQEQISEAATAADIILLVIEAPVGVTEEDRQVARLAFKSKKPVFLIVNKADQAHTARRDDFRGLGIRDIFLTNVPQKSGFIELRDAIVGAIPKVATKPSADGIRVALLGRPNAGKSALFNAIAKKQQAIVSERAGTTRDINRTSVTFEKTPIEILDTAGIRRSGKIERGVEKFSVLRALQAIEEADVCMLLMDVQEMNTQLDQKIAGMIKDAGKGLIIVVSKWDSIEKDPKLADKISKEIAYHFQFVAWAPLVFTSAF